MERRLVGHISAANRDRRTELERFRRELMGTLEMIAMPGPKIMGSGSGGTGTVGSAGKGMGKTVTSPVSPKEAILGATPRKFDAASLKAVAPIAAGMDEARLAQVLRGAVEDVLHARGTVQEEVSMAPDRDGE